jgi:hypothetical protein
VWCSNGPKNSVKIKKTHREKVPQGAEDKETEKGAQEKTKTIKKQAQKALIPGSVCFCIGL